MAAFLWMGDITRIPADAVVNAANSELTRQPGICDAIFQAAGESALRHACAELGHCPIGHAVITPGFRLPATYIIHVAGSEWYGGSRREEFLLGLCYKNALNAAVAYNCKKVAFPLIFSGEYHIPRPRAIEIAGEALSAFIAKTPLDVILVLYKPGIFKLAKMLLGWPTLEWTASLQRPGPN